MNPRVQLTPIVIGLVAGLWLAALPALRAQPSDTPFVDPVEFNGLVTTGGVMQFSLRDTVTGASNWVAVDGRFEDYLVWSFDPQQNLLVVAQDGAPPLTLHLKGAITGMETPVPTSAPMKAEPAAPPLTPEQQKAAAVARQAADLKAVLENLRRLSDAATQYFQLTDSNSVLFSDLVGPEPSKLIKQMKSVAGEDYRALTITTRSKKLTVTLLDGTKAIYERPAAPTTATSSTTTAPAPATPPKATK